MSERTIGPYDDDSALLRAAAAGQPAAVRELLDTVGAVVYGFVFARVGGDAAAAEDIVQDTIIESIRSAHTFRGEAALSTWVCAIARRRVARHYDAERRDALARTHLEAAPRHLPSAAEDVDQQDEVIRALGRLPAVYRQVLVLKYLDDLAVAEIAALVGRTRVQVQSLLQRAREGLRLELEAGRA